jgi:hypothetical protein
VRSHSQDGFDETIVDRAMEWLSVAVRPTPFLASAASVVLTLLQERLGGHRDFPRLTLPAPSHHSLRSTRNSRKRARRCGSARETSLKPGSSDT